MVKGIIGACIGGAIGAAVWGAIAYFTGYELAFLAWIVGGMVGLGMAVGAKDDTDNITGARRRASRSRRSLPASTLQ